MSYNIFLMNREPEAAIEAILNADPDVVVLEEVSPGWAPYLRRRCQRTYPYIAFMPNPITITVGVMSKYPLRNATWLPARTDWISACRVQLRHPGGPVQILGVHLRPLLWAPGGITLSRLIRVGSEHLADIEHYVEHLEAGLPTLIAGDFNEADRGRAVRWLIETRGMASALGRFDPKSPTWHADLGFYHLATRLDHILHSAHFACTAARVIPTRGSDHYPVVATLKRTRP